MYLDFLDSNIFEINNNFIAKVNNWTDKIKVLGVVDTIVKNNKGTSVRLPYVTKELFSIDNKEGLIFADDDYRLISYHRLLKKSYQKELKSYGDNNSLTMTADLQLIVFVNNDENYKPSLEMIEYDFMNSLTEQGSVLSSDFDRVNIFASEFPNTKFCLPKTMQMLRVNYQIKIKNIKCKIKN